MAVQILPAVPLTWRVEVQKRGRYWQWRTGRAEKRKSRYGGKFELLRELREQAETLMAEASLKLEEAQQDDMTQAAVAQVVRKAGKAGEAVDGAMAGWGMGPGSDVRLDPQAALEFARRNSARLRQIAELAGRMRGIALQARRERVAHGPVIAEAGLTQDLMRVFPGELALLRPDVPELLRAQQIARWADGGLLGWRLRGEAEKKGPFVAGVDVSGSMDGWREMIAKAVALGVAQAAKAEERTYTLFTFGADNDPVFAVESHESWVQHLDWAGKSRGGGTSFNKALEETMARLIALGRKAKGADALFISDGEAIVSSEMATRWKAFCQEVGARLLYVPVARGGYGSIEKLADRVIALAELDVNSGAGLARDAARWLR